MFEIVAWINIDDVRKVGYADISKDILYQYEFKDGTKFYDHQYLKILGLAWHFKLHQKWIDDQFPKYTWMEWFFKERGIEWKDNNPFETRYTEREYILWKSNIETDTNLLRKLNILW